MILDAFFDFWRGFFTQFFSLESFYQLGAAWAVAVQVALIVGAVLWLFATFSRERP